MITWLHHQLGWSELTSLASMFLTCSGRSSAETQTNFIWTNRTTFPVLKSFFQEPPLKPVFRAVWSFLLTGITFTSVWTSDSLYYFIYVLWVLTRQIPVWTKLIGPCIITEPQPALKQVYLSGQLFWPLSVICGQWLERITTLSI